MWEKETDVCSGLLELCVLMALVFFLFVFPEDMQGYPNETINYMEVKSILCFMGLKYNTNEFNHLEKFH